MKKKKTIKAKTAKRARAISQVQFEEPMALSESNPMVENRESLSFKAMQFLGLKL